jgi:hypothetical protein
MPAHPRAERSVAARAAPPARKAADNASGRVTVRGVVTNPAGQAIAGAIVRVPALNQSTVTAADGSYVLSLPATRDTVQVIASRLGSTSQSRPLATDPEAASRLDFALATSAIALEGLVVTSTTAERRRLPPTPDWREVEQGEAERRLGARIFILPDLPVVGIEVAQIDRRPAVRVVQTLATGEEVTLVQRRAPRARSARPCEPRTHADGEGARVTVLRGGVMIEASAAIAGDSLRALLCSPAN